MIRTMHAIHISPSGDSLNLKMHGTEVHTLGCGCGWTYWFILGPLNRCELPSES